MVAPTRRSRVQGVLAGLRAAADPVRREHSLGYFPTSMEILGVPVPAVRKILRPLARDLADASGAEVLAVARALLDTRVHEARQVAHELVGGRGDVVAQLDAAAVRALGEGNDNWGAVDCFSVFVSGPAWRDGRVGDGDVLGWAADVDPWWRRTALVSTVALNARSRGGRGEPVRTLRVCARLAGDPHPMVAKGLSWALRALVDVDREGVRTFLGRHEAELPALVRREVGNKLRTGRKSGRA
ncbi:MAG: hypothetical protein AMXMBFR53_18440 [Gemmatimonadota bacterium]